MGASGRVGLTVVGQVVGSYFGPIGAAVGGALGAYLGGALWPEQIEGPRLEGLQVSSSSYGWPIPEVYGTVRTAGNLVWRYPLDSYYETATTEDVGKGGGPEVTTYTYSLDLAMLVCEGPVIGIRRVWADQRLIYDVSAQETSTLPTGASGSIGAAVELLIATAEGKASAMRVYLGDEAQLPDPTIESHVGVGNTPAYRGYCYLVFPNFNLTDFGNRIPNITVEVVKGGSAVGPQTWYQQAWGLSYESGSLNSLVRLISADGVLTVAPSVSAYQRAWTCDLDGTNVRPASSSALGWPNHAPNGTLGWETLLLWTGSEAIYTVALPTANASDADREAFSVIEAVIVDAGARTYTLTGGVDWSSTLSDGFNFVRAIVPCADREHVIAIYCDPNTATSAETYWVLYRYSDGFAEVDRGTCAAGLDVFPAGGNVRSANGGVPVYYCGMIESDLRHVWIGGNAGNPGMYLFEIGDDGVMRYVNVFSITGAAAAFGTVTAFADNGVCWFEASGYLHAYYRIPTLPLSQPTLAEVVTSICAAGGLDPADIDVTDLAGVTVRGYLRPTRMSGRAALEPLMTAYAFDAVESDLKIKFRLRDATVDATIPADDLGAGDEGDGAPVIESDRMQESELPQSIDLSYMDADADYQVGTQLAQRLAVTSEDRQSIQLALALQAWQAASIVNRMLFEVWVARTTRKFKTTLAYAKYEPTDVMVVQASDGATYTVRAIDKRERGQLIEWTGVDVDAAGFNPAGAVATSPGGGPLATPAGPTELFAADLPPLRGEDFGTFGFYAAGHGLGSATWPGAVVYASADGADYEPVVELTQGATLGFATSVLGRWGTTSGADEIYGGYTVDVQNSVEVSLVKGTLASCSFDDLLALTNVALIGDEIVAFMYATSVATGVYRLSGLLRGLQGTEQAAARAGGHAGGDRFVLLSALTLRRAPGTYAEAVQGPAFVKGVTAGRTLAGATAQTLERTGAGAVPPAPTHTNGTQSGSDLVVTFTRRSYVDGTWDSGRDVPALSTEEYAIDVNLTGGARKTFIRSGPAPHTITAAELATIGGTVAGVAFYVAQVPPATPGSTALLGTPATRPDFWSRRTSVTWT